MKKILALFLLVASTAAFAGNCDYSWERDSAGNRCGDRSASNRNGGK